MTNDFKPITIFKHGLCRKCGGFNVHGFIDHEFMGIMFDCEDCMHVSSIRIDPNEWEAIHETMRERP